MKKIDQNMVEKYYNENFGNLSKEKKFHFASRLFLFTKKNEYREKVNELRPYYEWSEKDVEKIIDTELDKADLHLKKILNKKNFRQRSVERYPLIGAFNHILFKILFHSTIYNIDLSENLKGHDCTRDMKEYFDLLPRDPESIFILSTHAINFLFLFKDFFDEEINISEIAAIAKTDHGLKHTDSLQSSIYLLTHIIICESLFYARTPDVSRDACIEAFNDVEMIIKKNYHMISLDQKLEFLVCAIILEQITPLREKILHEAAMSKSPNGDFIVDQLNEAKGVAHLQDLEGSEHRNVLYIMTNY